MRHQSINQPSAVQEKTFGARKVQNRKSPRLSQRKKSQYASNKNKKPALTRLDENCSMPSGLQPFPRHNIIRKSNIPKLKPKTSSIYQRLRERKRCQMANNAIEAQAVTSAISTLATLHFEPPVDMPPKISTAESLGSCKPSGLALGQRAPISLYMLGDEDALSGCDCLIRKNLQYFESPTDGAVGIRCRNCSHQTTNLSGTDDAVAYPSSINRILPVAYDLAMRHLCNSCPCVSDFVRDELRRQMAEQQKRIETGEVRASAEYWVESAKASGIFEKAGCLGWKSHIAEGETRQKFVHKQYYKTLRKGIAPIQA